jgi:hypothetical protein
MLWKNIMPPSSGSKIKPSKTVISKKEAGLGACESTYE